MAILNKIRQKTFVLILVIALALFAFILSSLIDNSDALMGKSQNVVATINGEDITREAFMFQVEQQQRQLGPNATSSQVMNRVFENNVRQAVMDTEFKKLGLSVETEQMREILRTNLANSPEFKNEAGLFDDNKLTEYISNLKETSKAQYQQWVSYEQSMANSGLQTSYFNLVKAGTTATVAEGKLQHKLEGDKVNMSYVSVPFSSIADSTITLSDSEIKNYISKNESQYQVEANVDVQYVLFNEVASVQDKEDIKTALLALVNDKEVYENGKTEVQKGFAASTDLEDFVNENSDDIKYNKDFQLKSQLPSVAADTLTKSNIGSIYGPYLDGSYFKLSKLEATTKLPDSVKARHILISYKGLQGAPAEETKTEAQAKVFADSLATILRKDTSNFEAYVTEYSADTGSVEKGGLYDFYPYNQMVPEFRDFTFEKNKGEIGVVKTAFGFHIIENLDQKGEQTLYKVATIARKIEPSEATIDKVFRDASSFEVALADKSFTDVASDTKVSVLPVLNLKELDENISGLGSQRAIVRWAFNEGTSIGDYKRFSIANGYAIVQLTKQVEAGLMPVKDARVLVGSKLINDKKTKQIMESISAATLEDFAKAKGQQVKTATAVNMMNPTVAGAGREPYIVGYAFGLKDGETSKLLQGETGVFMIKRTGFTPAVELDNYQSFANQVSSKKLSAVQSQLYNALKDAADIEDNRARTVQ